jgi:hypothetical protein
VRVRERSECLAAGLVKVEGLTVGESGTHPPVHFNLREAKSLARCARRAPICSTEAASGIVSPAVVSYSPTQKSTSGLDVSFGFAASPANPRVATSAIRRGVYRLFDTKTNSAARRYVMACL